MSSVTAITKLRPWILASVSQFYDIATASTTQIHIEATSEESCSLENFVDKLVYARLVFQCVMPTGHPSLNLSSNARRNLMTVMFWHFYILVVL
jgi:hypothetical protein